MAITSWRASPAFAVALGLCGLQVCQAAEKAFPTKPIRIIVSAAAGGNLDVTMRALAPHMTATLGRSLVIENRAGGNSLRPRAWSRTRRPTVIPCWACPTPL